MGNIISAITPNQFLPVETLISDVKDIKYVASLGSTRFMKVARVSDEEGAMVFKVFVPHDEGFPTAQYLEQVIQIRNLLYSAYNCCPFSGIHVTPRCTILSRQYHKETLYNRLSIRPYLLDIEKKWITFQLLKALAQCEVADICHGDLKTQNVLISSCNWVQITDFATFKPALVASDDPSYFNFFFDTSRRSTCYLAPERFYPSYKTRINLEGRKRFVDFSKILTNAMDIFSMGCVLVELNSTVEEYYPFNYGKLIKYKESNTEESRKMLQEILENVPHDLRDMLEIMLSKSPSHRKPATQLLQMFGPSLFPFYFECFMYNYLNMFRPKVMLSNETFEKSVQIVASMDSDDVINKLWNDIDLIMKNLKDEEMMKKDAHIASAVLIISLVTCNMRALKSITSKMISLKLLEKFAAISEPSIVADRILPYIVNMLTDSVTLVRSEAIVCITKVLSTLKEISLFETRLFIDYLFPHFKAISTDPSYVVQMTLAENLGVLAETSVKFLRHSSKSLTDDLLGNSIIDDGEGNVDKHEELTRLEMLALHDAVNEIFINLCGSDNNIKHCLVARDSLKMLCQFFDRQKATDVLLSHAITFLNDKTDWRLRATFFESCPIIATFVGRQSTFILRSLLQQGLHDYEEFVQLQALRCICKLCEQQLLDKAAIYGLFSDVIPFLSHPNEWLRLATVNILVAFDSTLNIADIHIKLMPILSSYITEDILIKLNNKFAIISILRAAIPRPIWDYVLNSVPLIPLLDFLAEKKMALALDDDHESLFCGQIKSYSRSHDLKICLKRLETLGLTREYEKKILHFDNVLRKMSSLMKMLEKGRSKSKHGVIDLSDFAIPLRSFSLNICDNSKMENLKITDTMIFGDIPPEILVLSGTKSDSSTTPDSLPASKYLETESTMCTSSSWDVSIRTSSCRSMLSRLIACKRDRYQKMERCYPVQVHDDDSAVLIPSQNTRHLGTQLVVSLKAHKESIKKLIMDASSTFFASAGSDGMAKLWSINRMQTNPATSLIPESTFSYSSKIHSIGFMNNSNERLAVVGGDSRICIIDVERNKLITSVSFAKSDDGAPLDLIVAENLLHIRTQNSAVFCFDCRSSPSKKFSLKPLPVWRFKISNAYGFINSFCLDPTKSLWMCLTSTNRSLILWDLRFGLEVKSWLHPNALCRFMRCWPAVKHEQSNRICNEVWASSSCSGEISKWKLETARRSNVLWPAVDKAPLIYAADKYITTALTTCPFTENIITGDNYGALRFWNAKNVNECLYLSGPLKKNPDIADVPSLLQNNIRYTKSTVDATNVIAENYSEYNAKILGFSDRSCSNQITNCHKSAIEDLLCTGDLLISASRDGIIKVWK